ncbi:MAG: ABC transporter ATP-binding protein/permease [Bacilli bacterium]|nr:ABC transporter ATP-binding protein/permease [Bacilli bacterium]
MPPVRIKERGRAKKGTMTRLLKQLFKLYPGRLVTVFICIVFNVFANLCSSIFANFITVCLTNAISKGANPFEGSYTCVAMGITVNTNITVLLVTMGVIYIIGIFSAWYWNRTMAILTQKFLNDFRIRMFDHLQDLPIKYFDTHQHGEVMSLFTNDIDTIRQFISQAMPSLIQAGFAVIFCFVTMLINSIWMTLVTILCTIAMFMTTKVIGGRSSKYFIKQQVQVSKVEGNIEEAINGLKVIKVFSHEEKSCDEFDELNNTLCEYSTEANISGNITMPINGNIGNFMYVLTATVGFLMLLIPSFYNVTILGEVYSVGSSPESISTFWGMIVAFLMMSRMFTNNVNTFSQQIIFIVMGMAGASRCFDLLDEIPEQDEGYVTLVNVKKDENGNLVETTERTHMWAWKHPHKADGTVTYTELKGDILLDHVDFSYNGTKMILHDICIYAHPGQQIALVGATGAGKTTITNLINRFYPLADGKVRYDGININKIKKEDLRRSLGIVLQDVNLFTGTVMENIRYGRLDATDEECIAAAKIANAHDFITRLPEGYNTMLSGDGANLSQGQRQLLSIARAAVADAPVMILDEATSSIDTRTEKLVQQGMDGLMKGRTVFAIAHRLSTIQNSNAIMCMEHGRIIERGDHDELIAKKGYYYQLYTGAFELE